MNLTTSKNWVDTHFHVFHAGEAVAGARYVPQYTAALSDWQSLAQSAGVTRGDGIMRFISASSIVREFALEFL